MTDTQEAQLPVRNFQSFIVWINGEPEIEYRQLITTNVLAELPLAALSLPYKRTEEEIFLGEDPEFEHMSNAEVMNIRLARRAAAGSMDATKTILDRVLGRPKQQIESRTISETYTQYLERLAAEEEEDIEEASVDG